MFFHLTNFIELIFRELYYIIMPIITRIKLTAFPPMDWFSIFNGITGEWR